MLESSSKNIARMMVRDRLQTRIPTASRPGRRPIFHCQTPVPQHRNWYCKTSL